jgi:hypothetical protein
MCEGERWRRREEDGSCGGGGKKMAVAVKGFKGEREKGKGQGQRKEGCRFSNPLKFMD